jgi:hypothetical protein
MINPSARQSSPAVSDDGQPRMSDIALRKKKNADAQAAFRARRANYIASLEETGASSVGRPAHDAASRPRMFFFPPSPLSQ